MAGIDLEEFSRARDEMKKKIDWKKVARNLVEQLVETGKKLKNTKEWKEKDSLSDGYKGLEKVDEDATVCTFGYIAYPFGEYLKKRGVIAKSGSLPAEEVWLLRNEIHDVLSRISERTEKGKYRDHYIIPKGEFLITLTEVDTYLEYLM